jgi:hypothetical protein
MPFSEATKRNVKQRADFTCCWCTDRKNKVDAHHIIPEAANGPNTFDNAAPLCGTCHDLYGANPELPKEIKARRDYWYSVCDARRSFQWPVSARQPEMTTCHPYEPSLAKTEQGADLRYGTPGVQLFSADRAVDIVVNAANAHGVRLIAFSLSFPFGLGFNLGIVQLTIGRHKVLSRHCMALLTFGYCKARGLKQAKLLTRLCWSARPPGKSLWPFRPFHQAARRLDCRYSFRIASQRRSPDTLTM